MSLSRNGQSFHQDGRRAKSGHAHGSGQLTVVRNTGNILQQLVEITGHGERFYRHGLHAVFDQEAGALQGEIAGKIGVPPFAVKKTLDLARQYTMKQLADMARLSLETEYQVKSGQLMDVGSLERVMLEILSMREGHHG